MKKVNILFLTVLGMSGLGLGINNAISKSDNVLPERKNDAIMNAQTIHPNPEQKKVSMTALIFSMLPVLCLLQAPSSSNRIMEKFSGLIFTGMPSMLKSLCKPLRKR